VIIGHFAVIVTGHLTRGYRREGDAAHDRRWFQNNCFHLHRVLADEAAAR
jgi:hypothetical protein